MYLRGPIALIAALTLAAGAQAQAPAVLTVSLDDAVRLALANSPDLVRDTGAVRAATASPGMSTWLGHSLRHILQLKQESMTSLNGFSVMASGRSSPRIISISKTALARAVCGSSRVVEPTGQ